MISFKQFFLTEASGGAVSNWNGHISEATINHIINKYYDHRQNNNSHEEALNKIKLNKSIHHHDLFNDDVMNIAKEKIGDTMLKDTINHSINGAISLIDHIHHHEGKISGFSHWTGPEGEQKVEKKYGHKTNADLIIPTQSGPIAIGNKNTGASLKYSTSHNPQSIKLRSVGLGINENKQYTGDRWNQHMENLLNNTLNVVAPNMSDYGKYNHPLAQNLRNTTNELKQQSPTHEFIPPHVQPDINNIYHKVKERTTKTSPMKAPGTGGGYKQAMRIASNPKRSDHVDLSDIGYSPDLVKKHLTDTITYENNKKHDSPIRRYMEASKNIIDFAYKHHARYGSETESGQKIHAAIKKFHRGISGINDRRSLGEQSIKTLNVSIQPGHPKSDIETQTHIRYPPKAIRSFEDSPHQSYAAHMNPGTESITIKHNYPSSDTFFRISRDRSQINVSLPANVSFWNKGKKTYNTLKNESSK